MRSACLDLLLSTRKMDTALLETILLLRDLEVPISVIQDFMKNRSAKKLKDLLEEKIADLDLKLTHLQAVRETLCTIFIRKFSYFHSCVHSAIWV